MVDFLIEPGKGLRGEITLPGDKSISHRAIMCASLASGTSEIKGFLDSEDCLATLRNFQEMGIDIEKKGDLVIVKGKGLHGLSEPKKILDMGNSGTSMRLTAGILVGQKFNSILSGDKSLLKRPMKRITEPLSLMGCSIKSKKDGTPPLQIFEVDQISSIKYKLPIASAQVKSCIMFAALYGYESTVIEESELTRDHTERIFKKFGIPVKMNHSKSGKTIIVKPTLNMNPCKLEICSDFSSAAFFILAAIICPNSFLTIKNVGINETRTGFLYALKKMGGNIKIKNLKEDYEPSADIVVKSSKLRGIDLDSNLVSNIIDELPSLFIAASLAKGITRIKGAEELRYKESDRLTSMANALESFGVSFDLSQDGINIRGLNQSLIHTGNKGPFKEAEIDSFDDHRVAMASAIGALRSKGPCIVKNCDNVATSFPSFLDTTERLGISIKKN